MCALKFVSGVWRERERASRAGEEGTVCGQVQLLAYISWTVERLAVSKDVLFSTEKCALHKYTYTPYTTIKLLAYDGVVQRLQVEIIVETVNEPN